MSENHDARRKVLITGAAGRIANCLREEFAGRYDLRGFDRDAICEFPSVVGNLSDLDALKRAMQGVETVVHLAATKREAPFIEDLVPNNIVGAFNVFEAAREAGVRRIVFASSAQSVAAYPKDQCLDAANAPRPSSLYGAAKVLSETMGRFYFDHHGIEFIGIRIGWLLEADDPILQRDGYGRRIWLSPRDAVSLFRCAIEVPIGVGFDGYAVVFGTSKIEPPRLSLDEARALGYEPQDDVSYLPFFQEGHV